MTRSLVRAAFCFSAFLLPLLAFESQNELTALRSAFASPPDNARILMRWWWFGGAVEKTELERELRAMKAVGIGGVEIQPVYPLELDDDAHHIRNEDYLSPAFLENLHFAAAKARELGLRIDITLGSGWPYGGPGTPIARAAGRLRVERVYVPEGARFMSVPALENGETLIAAFVGGRQVAVAPDRRVELPPGLSGNDVLQFFISSRTGQQVKRASVGAEGFVLDHYDRSAITDHLARIGNKLLSAFGDQPPYSVFSDSLEVYGSDWTPAFLAEFRKRRGYDLTPYLPELVEGTGQRTPALRHDWGKTLTELAEENYLRPIHEWAHAHGTLFRSQSYGEPPVILSSNAEVDLPEGEHGPRWRRFSAARWASSANHLSDRPITSTETWTWLHSPVFRANPLDLKAEADRHFVEGVNQLVGHGWPYSPPEVEEPGFRFYAAAALNEHNPWFGVMPDITRYLQRVSFLLRQGKPATDIAIYLPTDDAWAHLQLGKTAVDEMSDTLLGPVLIPAVLNAGYSFDFIDDRTLARSASSYRVIIVPGIERMSLASLEALQRFTASGGHLIATRSLPSRGPGLLEEQRDSTRIASLAHELFGEHSSNARFVEHDAEIAGLLPSMLPPDFVVTAPAAAAIGFVHRKLSSSADVYFVANATNRPVDTHASVRVENVTAERWDPFTGGTHAVPSGREGARTGIHLVLAPYESRILVFSSGAEAPVPEPSSSAARQTLDLASDWDVTFTQTQTRIPMPRLRSWTVDEATRYYSGTAIYRKTVSIPAALLADRSRLVLDFGPGVPVDPDPRREEGMHALLDGPVRESAIISVNGQRAGTIWHPPYELDVTRFLHAGPNRLAIEVANLALNEMAGRPLPDYRLLNLRYGERFTAQDMGDVKPLPSGILGPLRLLVYR